MNKQEKLEATAIVAPVIRANAKANNKRKVTTYDQATGKTVRETTVLVLQESLLAKAEILGVDVKQELKREESGACKKCGELRKSKFTNGNSKWCMSCANNVYSCQDCSAPVSRTGGRKCVRNNRAPRCRPCSLVLRRMAKPICRDCGHELSERRSSTLRCRLCLVKAKIGSFHRLTVKPKGKYVGIYYEKRLKRWTAQVTQTGGTHTVHVGRYGTPEEAARAYDIAACDMRGKYARCNFGEAMYI